MPNTLKIFDPADAGPELPPDLLRHPDFPQILAMVEARLRPPSPAAPAKSAVRVRVEEAARIAGYSLSQFRRLVAAGSVPGARQRCRKGKWTFDADRVRRWAEDGYPATRRAAR